MLSRIGHSSTGPVDQPSARHSGSTGCRDRACGLPLSDEWFFPRRKAFPLRDNIEIQGHHTFDIHWQPGAKLTAIHGLKAVSYTHLRAHETDSYLVCRLLLE